MLTVIFATRNRAPILRDVLTAFCNLQAPESGWKLVVVDNGSTDETQSVLSSFADRLPLRMAFERRIGKNHALNMGLHLAEGDLIVFTDDDSFPNPDWLVHLRRVADSQPDFSIFGGPVVPRWQVPPPPWISWVEAGPAFGLNSAGIRGGPIPRGPLEESVREILGPNMALRSAVLQRGYHFDVSIGPRGNSYAMGSESELLLRLTQDGEKAWFTREAVVAHLIRKEQMDEKWILKRGVRFGRGMQRLFPVKLWGPVPRHLFRDVPKELILIAVAFVTRRHDKLFQARWRLNMLRGKAMESWTRTRLKNARSGSCDSQPSFKIN